MQESNSFTAWGYSEEYANLNALHCTAANNTRLT